MRTTLRHFRELLDLKMAIVLALALLSTYACEAIGLRIDMPLELVGIAIVFPIVFSIGQAFQRREAALLALADFKTSLAALLLAHRDWPSSESARHEARAREILTTLHHNVHELLRRPSPALLSQTYAAFSEISRSNERLRREGEVSPTEISRANQYLKVSMFNLEKMRNISIYRTPRALRSFTQIFLSGFPIIFGPYFAFLSDTWYSGVGYGVAILYTVVLVGLDNIQEGLENPYDGIGVDDIRFSEDELTSVREVGRTPLADSP
jgi:hypothetical protein